MTGKSAPGRFAARERVALALQLRRDGATFDQVAAHIGPDGRRLYSSKQAAARAVLRELRRIPKEQADEARALELGRLDALHRAVWPEATTPAGPVRCGECDVQVKCPECGRGAHRGPNLHAANTVIRVSERRAGLLGLDFSDRTAARAVQVLDEQAQMTGRALMVAIDRAGLPDDTARALLGHLADALREIDEDDDGPGGGPHLTIVG